MLGWMERILELLVPILDRWPQGVDDLTDAAALAALVALVFSARRVRGVAPVWSAARALANLLLGFLSVLVLFRLALELPPDSPRLLTALATLALLLLLWNFLLVAPRALRTFFGRDEGMGRVPARLWARFRFLLPPRRDALARGRRWLERLLGVIVGVMYVPFSPLSWRGSRAFFPFGFSSPSPSTSSMSGGASRALGPRLRAFRLGRRLGRRVGERGGDSPPYANLNVQSRAFRSLGRA